MGKYKGDTPPQHHRPMAIANPAQQASMARFTAIQHLNTRLGGRWNWDDRAHRFTAEFDTPIAEAIQVYLHPHHITLNKEGNGKRTILSVNVNQLTAIEEIAALRTASQSLAKTYQTLLGNKSNGR